MTHVVNTNHIAAACHTAAVLDNRHVLVGVLVDCRIVVSCDGACLSAYLGEECEEYLVPFIIPLEAAKLIAKLKSARVNATRLPDGRIDVGGIVFTPIDGKFPDYRRAVSKVKPGPHEVQLAPDVVAKFAKIAKSLGSKGWPQYFPSESNGSMRVAIADREREFIGVAMGFSTKIVPVCGDWLI